jgi:hypothetical protein
MTAPATLAAAATRSTALGTRSCCKRSDTASPFDDADRLSAGGSTSVRTNSLSRDERHNSSLDVGTDGVRGQIELNLPPVPRGKRPCHADMPGACVQRPHEPSASDYPASGSPPPKLAADDAPRRVPSKGTRQAGAMFPHSRQRLNTDVQRENSRNGTRAKWASGDASGAARIEERRVTDSVDADGHWRTRMS